MEEPIVIRSREYSSDEKWTALGLYLYYSLPEQRIPPGAMDETIIPTLRKLDQPINISAQYIRELYKEF
jgi:hypothetical protein